MRQQASSAPETKSLTASALRAPACNAKIPVKDRDGVPFEYTWHSFLQLMFLPKMKKVIKDMKRGIVKRTL